MREGVILSEQEFPETLSATVEVADKMRANVNQSVSGVLQLMANYVGFVPPSVTGSKVPDFSVHIPLKKLSVTKLATNAVCPEAFIEVICSVVPKSKAEPMLTKCSPRV